MADWITKKKKLTKKEKMKKDMKLAKSLMPTETGSSFITRKKKSKTKVPSNVIKKIYEGYSTGGSVKLAKKYFRGGIV